MDRDTAEEVKRHFQVVAEGLRSEIRIVADAVQSLREEVNAEFRVVREEIAEIKAMIPCPSVSSTSAFARSKKTRPPFGRGSIGSRPATGRPSK